MRTERVYSMAAPYAPSPQVKYRPGYYEQQFDHNLAGPTYYPQQHGGVSPNLMLQKQAQQLHHEHLGGGLGAGTPILDKSYGHPDRDYNGDQARNGGPYGAGRLPLECPPDSE